MVSPEGRAPARPPAGSRVRYDRDGLGSARGRVTSPKLRCWLFQVPRAPLASFASGGGEVGEKPSRGRARAPYGDGGGTCWCTQCSDSLSASLEDQGPLVLPEEEPRWGGGQPEGPAKRTLCGPSSNPFSRNTGWGWLRSLWKCTGQRNRKHRRPLRNTFAWASESDFRQLGKPGELGRAA